MNAERPKRQPDTELDPGASAPPTRLDQDAASAPPTSRDGAGGSPPTSIDSSVAAGDGDGDTYVQLPRTLRADYEALRDMASGGEGDLLLVRHRESGELRVVKIYRGERRRDEEALKILSSALKEHVVKVYESDRTDGRYWEVMEYCEQGSLADLIANEGPRFSTDQIVEVVAEVAAALEHMHGLQIPHRDLKPGNILIRTREPLDLVLADFGLARVIAATKEMHSRVLSAGYASPQAVAGAVSPAMDWWSLGLIAAEMAQGRSPFQRETGEWLQDAVILDWIASRPIDFSGVEDDRLRLLCEGLTLRDDRRGKRWGAEEVRAWLAGESPEVAAEAAPAPRGVSASPFPFVDPKTKRTRPFTDPVELAAAMAVGWDDAAEVLVGTAARRSEQRALRNFLRSLGLAEAEQILAEQDDAEERLTRLLVQLDPTIPPTFRGFSVDCDGLLRLTEDSSESAAGAVEALFSERILLNYARSSGYEDLAELDSAWHEAMEHFETALEEAHEAAGREAIPAGAEHQAAAAGARRLVLGALIDEQAHADLEARAAHAAADSRARGQGWFAAAADELGHG
jgi:serine/threonine protein kinase